MSAHGSVWWASAEPPSFPTLEGDLAVDVAVVGGGITGLTTALLVQRSGARVAVIEARRIGDGTTGGTTGKVTSQHGLIYHRLLERHGERKARLYAEANQRGVELVGELAAEVDADCDLTRAAAVVYATNERERAEVEAEHEVAARLGLPAGLTSAIDLPIEVETALCFDDQLHLHPLRYLHGLARAVADRGGIVVEHTRALDVDEAGEQAVVRTDRGQVRARQVVVATLLPFLDVGGFSAKTRPTRAYGIAATLRREPPTGMHMNAGSPVRSTRPWRDGGRRGLIVVGENHPTGDDGASPAHWGDLERWTRDHFDVASFDHRWSAQDFTTLDAVPYVGRSPRTKVTFVATGFATWGLSNGTAAAVVLADLVGGRTHPWVELYDATRVGGVEGVKQAVEDNAEVAQRFVVDHLRRLRPGRLAELQRGTAALVHLEGRTVAAYRDPGGAVHAVSPTCTHLGCTVHWNAAETSWDCPCHGSRFDIDGTVLDGPAVRPLDRIEVEGEVEVEVEARGHR